MNAQDTGGPAFPCEVAYGGAHHNEHQTGNTLAQQYGMSLRDYFAAQALAGFCTKWNCTVQEIAESAYDCADAMLEARKA